MTTSYLPARTVPGGLDAELNRLRAQAELTWSEEFEIIDPRLDRAAPLLDAGCGPGEVARLLARDAPEVTVVGVDSDARMTERAAEHCAQTHTADLGDLPFEDATFGSVLTRYVLQHVTDLTGVLDELVRVLRPRGWLIAVDIDEQTWGACEPRRAGVEQVYAAAAVRQGAAGGDRRVVRRLTRQFSAAGLEDVALKAFAVDIGTRPLSELAVHLAPDRLIPAVAAGTISAAQYGLALNAHQQFLQDPQAYAMLLGFAVVGRRPG